jgi:hypothetical protein
VKLTITVDTSAEAFRKERNPSTSGFPNMNLYMALDSFLKDGILVYPDPLSRERAEWDIVDYDGNVVGKAINAMECCACGGPLDEALEEDEAGKFSVPFCPVCEGECFYCGDVLLEPDNDNGGLPNVWCANCNAQYDITQDPLKQGRDEDFEQRDLGITRVLVTDRFAPR